MARRIGYTDDQIASLDEPEATDLFNPAMKTALIFASKMTRNAHEVTDDLFARMRGSYTDTQILEITCVVSIANYFNRLTTALRIDLSGSNIPYDEAEI